MTTRTVRSSNWPRPTSPRSRGRRTSVARLVRRVPLPLAVLLGVAALLTVAWSFTLPPFQGPDESAHFNYAQHLAETGHRPTVTKLAGGPDSKETFTALYTFNLDQLDGVLPARPAWSSLEEQRFARDDAALGAAGRKSGSGPNPLGKNPPLYYAYEAIPYRIGLLGTFWDRLMLMRLSGGLLYLLAVLCTWLAAAEVFAGTWPRVLATGSVALLPQLTAISGGINADNLLIAVWCAFTLAALRFARRGPSVRRVLALCALAAASLLTHGRGIAIVPALLLVLAIGVLRHRPSLASALRWLAAGAGIVVAGAVVYLLVAAPGGSGAYGGEVTLHAGQTLSLRGLLNATWQFYFPRLPIMNGRIGPPYGYRQMFIESFFGRFASLEIAYPAAIYTLIQAACAVGLAGLVAFVVGRWAAVRARWAEAAVLVAITVSMLGLLHLASYRSLVGTGDPLITGRYLLPLVTVFGLAVAFVLTSVRPRLSALLGTIVLAGLLALNLGGLVLTVTRFYG